MFIWQNIIQEQMRRKTLVCNNNSQIPARDLRKLLAFIEANSNEIKQKWYEYFGEISYYC